MKTQISTAQLELSHLLTRCNATNPSQTIHSKQSKIIDLFQRLKSSQSLQITNFKQRFIRSTSTLEAVSPLATLSRGYAYVKVSDNDIIVKDSRQLQTGDQVRTTLAKGSFTSTVTKIQADK